MIRRFRPADLPWIRGLATCAYHDLGDYAAHVVSWLTHSQIFAYVDESPEGERRGFFLLGFFDQIRQLRQVRNREMVADLLALAVAPAHRGRGVGRTMVEYAIAATEAVGERCSLREMRLTVADDNAIGRQLYLSSGFAIRDEHYGSYPGGQRAIRMARQIRDDSEMAPGWRRDGSGMALKRSERL